MAKAGYFAALVHIRADHIFGAVFLEAGFAVTPVRAERIDALGVVRTHLALVQVALVDILAPVVPTDYVARRTKADVSATFVFAYLVRSALGLAGVALVHI